MRKKRKLNINKIIIFLVVIIVLVLGVFFTPPPIKENNKIIMIELTTINEANNFTKNNSTKHTYVCFSAENFKKNSNTTNSSCEHETYVTFDSKKLVTYILLKCTSTFI